MRRSIGRLAFAAAAVLTLFILSNVLERRHTALSCRTFSSCIGRGRTHAPVSSLASDADFSQSEVILKDGTKRFDRAVNNVAPEILVLVLSKDAASWSSDFRSTQRGIYDFLEMLASTELDLANVSLALMTSSLEEFEVLKRATGRLPLGRVTVMHRTDAESNVQYADRHSHDPDIQLSRRSFIAQLRNYLMSRALQDEKHILWIDADVLELSPNIVQTMINHSETKEAAGIITARCEQNQMDNYDKNAWRIASASLMGPVADPDREAAVRNLVETRIYVPQLIEQTQDTEIVSLDSVGGTVLYIRAHLVRQGVSFPTSNIVGTTWKQQGWVGVETEGLCYVARAIKGGGCFVLGGGHHVRHTDWG